MQKDLSSKQHFNLLALYEERSWTNVCHGIRCGFSRQDPWKMIKLWSRALMWYFIITRLIDSAQMKKYSMSALRVLSGMKGGTEARTASRRHNSIACVCLGKMKCSPRAPPSHQHSSTDDTHHQPQQQGLVACYKDRDHKHTLMADYSSQSNLPHLEKNNAFVA